MMSCTTRQSKYLVKGYHVSQFSSSYAGLNLHVSIVGCKITTTITRDKMPIDNEASTDVYPYRFIVS